MTSRVGVYNRYWRSQGGGERFTGMIAQVLPEQASVELICHDKVDVAALAAHLGLDLSRCSVRIVPDAGDGVLSEITSEYDLLVNGSYMSALPSQASKALYVCYFPTPADHDLAPWRRYVVRAVGPLARGGGQIIASAIWHRVVPAGRGRRRRYAWTSGDGKVHFRPGPEFDLAFDAARIGAEPADLAVTMDGVRAALHHGRKHVHRPPRAGAGRDRAAHRVLPLRDVPPGAARPTAAGRGGVAAAGRRRGLAATGTCSATASRGCCVTCATSPTSTATTWSSAYRSTPSTGSNGSGRTQPRCSTHPFRSSGSGR